MRLGLDIDGTITAMPDVFGPIARAVMGSGGQVYLVTGSLPGDGPSRSTNAGREAQAAQYGFNRGVEYVAIFICAGDDLNEVGKAKERICQAMGIELLIDNNHVFAKDVSRRTPCALLLGAGEVP